MQQEGKLYYKIGEVAEMLGVNTSLLRYWEGEFPNIKPKLNSAGKRIYTKDDIKELRLVQYLLKEKKMTIEGARKHLKEKKHIDANSGTMDVSVVDELLKIKDQLYQIRKELNIFAKDE